MLETNLKEKFKIVFKSITTDNEVELLGQDILQFTGSLNFGAKYLTE